MKRENRGYKIVCIKALNIKNKNAYEQNKENTAKQTTG